MKLRTQLMVALFLGVVTAAVPVFAATTREECETLPPPDAPHYLLLASEPTSRSLRCGPISARVVLQPVVSAAHATSRLGDEGVAGIIFDRAVLETLPGGLLRNWLTAGDGNALIGIHLTKWEVEAYLSSPPRPRDDLTPEERGESTYLRAHDYIARLSFRRLPNGGTCSGRGTPVFPSEEALAEILVRAAEGCRVS